MVASAHLDDETGDLCPEIARSATHGSGMTALPLPPGSTGTSARGDFDGNVVLGLNIRR